MIIVLLLAQADSNSIEARIILFRNIIIILSHFTVIVHHEDFVVSYPFIAEYKYPTHTQEVAMKPGLFAGLKYHLL